MRPTVFTIRTSQVAWCETLSGTTPARKRRPPLIPLLPTTTRSCPSASASFGDRVARIAFEGPDRQVAVAEAFGGVAQDDVAHGLVADVHERDPRTQRPRELRSDARRVAPPSANRRSRSGRCRSRPAGFRALRFGGSNDQQVARHAVGDAIGHTPATERSAAAHPDVADDDEAGIPAVGELDDPFGGLGWHRFRIDGDAGGFRAGFGRLDGLGGSLHAGFVLVHRDEQDPASRRSRQLERDPFGDPRRSRDPSVPTAIVAYIFPTPQNGLMTIR